MSRARRAGESYADGMSWIAIAPFPAFNPLNWWALTNPANAMQASLHATRMGVEAWRATADGMRAALRAQQDALLAFTDTATQATEPAPTETGQAAKEHDSAVAGVALVAPMLEVTRAYGQIGKAFIVAQRDAMRSFSEAGKPN